MLRNSKPLRLTDFSGGININDPGDTIRDNQCFASIDNYNKTRNVYWDAGLKKRGGTLAVNTEIVASDEIVNGFRLYKAAAPVRTTFVASNNGTDAVDIYYLDGSNVFQTISGTAIAVNSDVYFTSWKGCLYAATGTTVLQKISYSGSWSRDDITGNTSEPQFVVQHKDRLFVAGGNITQGQVQNTDYEYDDRWFENGYGPPAGSAMIANFGVNDGDPITALVPLGDDLIVYKNDSIWYLSGDNVSNWFAKSRQKEIGCVAPKSVANTPWGHCFLASDNKVYLFNMETLRPVSYNIQPWLDSIGSGMRIKAAGIFHKNYYRLALSKSGSSYNDIELIMDLRTFENPNPSWWLNDNVDINSYIRYAGPEDVNNLYYCDSDRGYLVEMDIGAADDGVDFVMEHHSKKYDMGQPHIEKAWDRLAIDLTSNTGNYTLKVKSGFDEKYEKEYTIKTGGADTMWSGSGGAIWGQSVWQGEEKTRYNYEDLLSPELDDTHLSIYFKHNEPYEDVEINSITISAGLKAF